MGYALEHNREVGGRTHLVVEEALELLDGEAQGEELEEEAERRGRQPRRACRPGLCGVGVYGMGWYGDFTFFNSIRVLACVAMCTHAPTLVTLL